MRSFKLGQIPGDLMLAWPNPGHETRRHRLHPDAASPRLQHSSRGLFGPNESQHQLKLIGIAKVQPRHGSRADETLEAGGDDFGAPQLHVTVVRRKHWVVASALGI